MSLGQGIAEMREKVVNGTFKSPTTTPSTSSRSQDLARVFPMADEPAVGTLTAGVGKPLNMYDGTPSTAGVEPRTPKTQQDIFAGCTFLFFFYCLKMWLEKVQTQNETEQTSSDAILKTGGTSTSQKGPRARVHSRSLFQNDFRPVSVKKGQRSALLSELRENELSEEEYFRIVNLSFKKPLQCALFCDQVKYTKFDPDCSWQTCTRPVSKIPSTPTYKKKTKHVKQVSYDHAVHSVSEEEFLELCNAVSKIGYTYASKKSKSKTTRSRAFSSVTLSPQSNFTMLLLSVLLPVAPFFDPRRFNSGCVGFLDPRNFADCQIGEGCS